MAAKNVFQRTEKKYKLSEKEYQAFMERVKDYISLDEYGKHTINNLYYDTDTYALIRNSIEKPKYKEKFRVRVYGKISKESTVFLEIKKKVKGVVFKRRAALSYDDAFNYLKHGIMPSHSNQIMKEIDYFLNFYHPVPKLYLAYDRMAYFGTQDQGLRLTIDQKIRSRSDHLDFEYGDSGTVLDDKNYLMEIKVPMAYPLWLTDILSDLKIYPVSFSKYGTIYKNAVKNGDLCPWLESENDLNKIQQEKGDKKCSQVYSAL